MVSAMLGAERRSIKIGDNLACCVERNDDRAHIADWKKKILCTYYMHRFPIWPYSTVLPLLIHHVNVSSPLLYATYNF
jgi:hypothetical protein